jgi:hypothetical protein
MATTPNLGWSYILGWTARVIVQEAASPSRKCYRRSLRLVAEEMGSRSLRRQWVQVARRDPKWC